MSEQTENLSLPYIMAAQAQKHVTHNEALRALDVLVQMSVEDRDVSIPPGQPNESARFIVGPSATDAWVTHEGDIAAFQDGAWEFYSPKPGWIAWVKDEETLVAFDGIEWVSAGGGETVPRLAINTSADSTNKLSVNSEAILFNHDGNDVRAKLNKNAQADTASLLFQSGFSGRAEVGLTGNDDFTFKVSPDGTNFYSGIVIDKDDGSVSFPNSAGGKLGQVVNVESTAQITVSGSTFTTVMSAGITPTNASSKILVLVQAMVGINASQRYNGLRVLRNTTPIGVGAASGNRTPVGSTLPTDGAVGSSYSIYPIPEQVLDSPNTTSAITYNVQIARHYSSGVMYFNRTSSNNDTVYIASPKSKITLLEILS